MPGPSFSRDHYAVLGVEPSATSRQITTAYRRQVRALHPDSRPAGGSVRLEELAAVVAAYAVLRDPELRRRYDADRHRGRTSGARRIPVTEGRAPGPPARPRPAESPVAEPPGFAGRARPGPSVRAGPVRVHVQPQEAPYSSDPLTLLLRWAMEVDPWQWP
ncbi:J domain-containing protein [Streptomyces pristinaespiralis]|uniref:J domain-containing protein n=1 Tax=Streptomyces pristinaespiralis TaxID=38300 RepID=UPI0038377CFE